MFAYVKGTLQTERSNGINKFRIKTILNGNAIKKIIDHLPTSVVKLRVSSLKSLTVFILFTTAANYENGQRNLGEKISLIQLLKI